MSKYKKGTDEWYIDKGTLILKICCFAFITVILAFFSRIFVKYFELFKYIFIGELVFNIILTIIAMNLIMKMSADNRFDFFTKYDRKSIDYKARVWVILDFIMMILNIMMICIL